LTAAQDQTLNFTATCAPGCCWAFATVGAFEAAFARATGILQGFSEQNLLDCSTPLLQQVQQPNFSPPQPWNCLGGWVAFPMFTNRDPADPNIVGLPTGMPLRSEQPYRGMQGACQTPSSKFMALTWGYVATDAFTIPSVPQLKQALCTNGPLFVAVFANVPAWQFVGGDVIKDGPNGSPVFQKTVNHAVVLVGWDDTKDGGAWLIKNSWGPTCGINNSGFMYVGYGQNNLGLGAAYVVADPSSGN
jgi:hypothetical protein